MKDKIVCPNCGSQNKLQKFCGECGEKLLSSGVEISNHSNKQRNTHSILTWSIGVGILVATWVFGPLILHLIATGFEGDVSETEQYFGLVSLGIGVILMFIFVHSRNRGESEEDTNQQI